MNRSLGKIVFAPATLFMATLSIWGQGVSSIRGLVTDPQKSVIALAKVTLTDSTTGQARSTVTSASGEYQFPQLRPGMYSIVVESPGFAKAEAKEIVLLVDTPSSLDFSLTVATSATTVDVMADVIQLN